MKPFLVFSVVLLIPTVAFSQSQHMDLPVAEQSISAASPEMDRLAKALAGDWNTVEGMERGQFFSERRLSPWIRACATGLRWVYVDL